MNHQPNKTTIRTYVQHIQGKTEQVFPLLCPVREAEWLEGWACEMIHSTSGVAEEGCVFRTRSENMPETIWIITHHDSIQKRVEFARVTTGLAATTLKIRLEETGPESTAVHVAYAFTPTSPEGASFVAEHHAEAQFQANMAWWERSMNHFLATGRPLRRADLSE